MFVMDNGVCRFGAGFVKEGVPPVMSNPTAKPTAKTSAELINAHYQKQP